MAIRTKKVAVPNHCAKRPIFL
ncbi:hypothetical protein CCACVL1_05116 [Corchorus capsularis]|uniref:Uncharacterized protein n=1 Tax=Corchorus capsularis TaxID=210143 RepID=A0A1R3JMF4_COCAP|nr:hypothetical protein CCACVL1_05116 [Corchorus capsularis]